MAISWFRVLEDMREKMSHWGIWAQCQEQNSRPVIGDDGKDNLVKRRAEEASY